MVHTASEAAPAKKWIAVVPSNTVNMAAGCRGIYVGGAGNVALVGDDNVAVTFTGDSCRHFYAMRSEAGECHQHHCNLDGSDVLMPGIGVRIGNPIYRTGPETGVVQMMVPEPDKLDGASFQLETIKNNLACRIFGRSNIATALNITVTWDAIPMNKTIFYGEAGVGKPFAGIWTLFNQNPRKAKLEILCGGKTNAGCAAIRAGSLGGTATLVSTDFETDLEIDYPVSEGNLMLLVGGCLDANAYPIYAQNAYMTEQWATRVEPKQGGPGAAAYFGSSFFPSPTGTFTLATALPKPGIIVAAEWSGVPA